MNLKTFQEKLRLCEIAANSTNVLTEWELKFIRDMRMKWDTRKDAFDLGVPAWEPSAKQMNRLEEIHRGVGF